jgi:N-acetylglutamate synthase-like GNAT family acetyltransferase
MINNMNFHIEIKDKQYSSFCVIFMNGDENIISSLRVNTSSCKKGLGTNLIQCAENTIKCLGGKVVILYVLPKTWQYDWYKRIGYTDSTNQDVNGYIRMEKNLITE